MKAKNYNVTQFCHIKRKGPHTGGLKNTNDEKNLFRKIQTEYNVYLLLLYPFRTEF